MCMFLQSLIEVPYEVLTPYERREVCFLRKVADCLENALGKCTRF